MNLHPPSQCLNIIKLNIEYKKKIIKKKKKKQTKSYMHKQCMRKDTWQLILLFSKKKKNPNLNNDPTKKTLYNGCEKAQG